MKKIDGISIMLFTFDTLAIYLATILGHLWVSPGYGTKVDNEVYRKMFEFLYCNLIIQMHIITRKRLNDFAKQNPGTTSALDRWYKQMKKASFKSLEELRTLFPNTDKVGKVTVFDIGGNKVRLIAAIYYNRKKTYIRAVLTHTEYDKNK